MLIQDLVTRDNQSREDELAAGGGRIYFWNLGP